MLKVSQGAFKGWLPYGLLVQQRQKQGQEVIRDEACAFGGGVDAIGLDSAGNRVHIGVKHGQKRHVVF